MRARRAFERAALVLGAWGASSCAPGLQSATVVDTVRILASSADEPYARPGDTVTLQVLAVDARPSKPAPMVVYWVPLVCQNPPGDAYYGCFPQLGGSGGVAGADAGAEAPPNGGGAGSRLRPGVDLSSVLPTGPSFQFTMPAGVIVPRTPAPPVPYGLAIVFNLACAGHPELLPLDPNNPQAPPIGCFDAQHNQLGPSDYVLGFTRVYAYQAVQNTNPVIDHVDVAGQAADSQLGFQVAACRAGAPCPSVPIGPVVPASSQETTQLLDMHQNPLKEEIWADFFSTVGSFSNDARLLYDSTTGSVGGPSDTDDQFQPPSTPGDGTIWIVVHDNRGGTAWATVPVHVF